MGFSIVSKIWKSFAANIRQRLIAKLYVVFGASLSGLLRSVVIDVTEFSGMIQMK